MTGSIRARKLQLMTGGIAALAAACAGPASAQDSAEPVKIGIVSFLTGPAAGPFGIPGRNAAEVIIEGMNSGSIPGHTTKGLGGTPIEAVYIDEAGSTANQVTEYRNLVQREGVDAVVGYVSSGNCLAVAPVAEEMKTLTVLYDCGTPRIFEEGSYEYVFRVTPHATMDSVGAARFVLDTNPELEIYGGINQNYAWGQDSWRDFHLAMEALKPETEVDVELFPKFLAGEYGAEISSLLTSNAEILHTSFYGGDLESFVYQSTARGLPQRMTSVMTCGESAMFRLGDDLADGTILGARGPHGVLAQESELNTWFREAFREKFGDWPTYPSYHMAQSLLGMKTAWDKAAEAKGGEQPTDEEVAAAFEGIEFQGPSTTIRMALGDGHQGISDTAYGIYKYNAEEERPEIVEVVRYKAECVNPPEGTTSVEWLEAGMPGAQCE